jgi:SAM-dependent methyltransferase
VPPENLFTGTIATDYARLWPELFDPAVVEPAVDFLAALADAVAGGRTDDSASDAVATALELGVGTGRLALPLSRRGVRMHGVELSEDMVEQLRRHEGADDVAVTLGDMATTRVAALEGRCALVYLVRNTIMNLTSQDAQVACFRNAAAHLHLGGCFVIEVIVPELRRLPPGERVRAFTVTPTHLGFDEFEPATQSSWSHHYWITDHGLETFSAPFRYVWPVELDLMARLGGMTLRERWADWDRSPFTSESRSHVSVWERVGEPTGW